jgi:hypothetical protein
MKGISLLFKHLRVALIIAICTVPFAFLIRMQWPGVNRLILEIVNCLRVYFVPLFILTIFLDILVIQKVRSKLIRYLFGLPVSAILLAYHSLFLLNAKEGFEKFLIFQAIFMGIMAVFLTEKNHESAPRGNP